MKPVFAELDHNSDTSLYVQLYELLRSEILSGGFAADERLPSLRSLSEQLGISVTTCARAYDQLMLEGYLEARPQSGYYVQKLDPAILPFSRDTEEAGYGRNNARSGRSNGESGKYTAESSRNSVRSGRNTGETVPAGSTYVSGAGPVNSSKYRYDPASFDFDKWRKCFTWVMNNDPEALLTPQDPQGEHALREQISEYLYNSRGVAADPDDIVISAGVQQLTGRLANMLKELGIDFVNVEDPGYKPIRHIFRDHDFTLNKISVAPDGLEIERLPVNIGTAVYVSPSNQFPTGSVMPAARRYQLLEWAAKNGSIIIEDDYDSELRYFGNPIPALKNMDTSGRVVYLGSFSSTLFPAIRISYMVLPEMLSDLFHKSMSDYDQTCSKLEQLVLAEYMRNGFYQAGIRKLRKLYARKLDKLLEAFERYGGDSIQAENTRSGITVRLAVRSSKPPAQLCAEAADQRLHVVPVTDRQLILYYDQIPIDEIDDAVKDLCAQWTDTR